MDSRLPIQLALLFAVVSCVFAQVTWENNYCTTQRNPCLNGGACVDRAQRPGLVLWYLCECPAQYTGDHCENAQTVPDPSTQNRYCTYSPNPCLNGGQCVDRSARPSLVSWYICQCPAGYSGDHCENAPGSVSDPSWENRYCAVNANPCLNGGQCVDRSVRPSLVSWYICQCPVGYGGNHCENIQGSVSDPSWENRYCAVNANPCLNSGQCVDRSVRPSLVSWYICQCPVGYTGDHCETIQGSVSDPSWENRYCAVNANPCLNAGQCVDRSVRPSLVSWYICQCPVGYAGDHCETIQGSVADPSWQNRYCAVNSNPCLNGGQCVDRSARPSLVSWYVCQCPSGYSGDHCEIIQGSVSDPTTENRYCSYNPNPCLHGGQCVDRSQRPSLVSWYVCQCPAGYTGDHCENRQVPDNNYENLYCSRVGNPCLNGGQCVDRSMDPSVASWYICRCPAGRSGDHCEHGGGQADPTEQYYCSRNRNPCLNNGRCVDRSENPAIISWYICACPFGYSGDHCEFSSGISAPSGYCSTIPNPCLSGGHCVDIQGGVSGNYRCQCPFNCRGSHCENCFGTGIRNMASCQEKQCLNGGTCVDLNTTSICYCIAECDGYFCEKCETAPPPIITSDDGKVCEPNPCSGDCTCHESCKHSAGYYCMSEAGFLGKNCSISPPRLVCEPNKIVISVSEDFLEDYDKGLGNSRIYVSPKSRMSDDDCVAEKVDGEYRIEIPLPFVACGTQATSSGAEAVFTNTMWINRVLSNPDFDVPLPVARFTCTYQKEYTVVTSMQPVVAEINQISRTLLIKPEVSLCKSPACPATCPQHLEVNSGAVYTVGETIHMSTTLQDEIGNVLYDEVKTLQSMSLSCQGQPTTPLIHLLKSSCIMDSGIPFEVSYSGMSSTVCTSFAVPRLPCDVFYIHAKMMSCPSDELQICSDSDVVSCPESVGERRKRSLAEKELLVIGPIFIIKNATTGRALMQVYPEEPVTPPNNEWKKPELTKVHITEDADKTWMYVLAGAVVVVVLCLFTLFVAVKRLGGGGLERL